MCGPQKFSTRFLSILRGDSLSLPTLLLGGGCTRYTVFSSLCVCCLSVFLVSVLFLFWPGCVPCFPAVVSRMQNCSTRFLSILRGDSLSLPTLLLGGGCAPYTAVISSLSVCLSVSLVSVLFLFLAWVYPLFFSRFPYKRWLQLQVRLPGAWGLKKAPFAFFLISATIYFISPTTFSWYARISTTLTAFTKKAATHSLQQSPLSLPFMRLSVLTFFLLLFCSLCVLRLWLFFSCI